MDVLTPEQRHKNMVAIKNKDSKIEIKLRKALWHRGFRYRKNYNKIPGKPDIVFTKYRIAVFCDSEFFHGKDWEELQARIEHGNNPEFWKKKISGNIEHDKKINAELKALGWRVIRFWGTEIKKNTEGCCDVIAKVISESVEDGGEL